MRKTAETNKNYFSTKSFVKVSVFGAYTEQYLDYLRKKSIRIQNVTNEDGIVFFECYPGKYRYVAEKARSFGMKTRVRERRGIYFKLRRYGKRYGIALGAMSFTFLIVFLNNFIWDINITGNETVTNVQIIEQLNKAGITIGVNINGFKAAEAELSVKLALDRLAWISIERVGSRVNVKVSERLEDYVSDIPVSTPCNVVAEKTGRIVQTEVYRGKLLLEKGSGVNKGDIIVSGVVEDGGGSVLLQHADAKIIAECEDETEFYEPFTIKEKKGIGKTVEKDYFIFLGNVFPLFIGEADSENAYYSEEMRIPEFFGIRLPFKIKTCIYKYYKEIDVTYGSTETMDRLNRQIEIYKNNFFKDCEIISFDVDYTVEEQGVKAKIKTVYRTNIAVRKAI